MLDDSLNIFDFSCQGKSGPPLWFGTAFILAGCLSTMMGLVFYCIIFQCRNTYSDRLNHQYAINEGLSGEVSNT